MKVSEKLDIQQSAGARHHPTMSNNETRTNANTAARNAVVNVLRGAKPQKTYSEEYKRHV